MNLKSDSYRATAKYIPVEKAKELQHNWINSRAMAIEREFGYEDTRDFKFSVSELQEYLDE